VSSHSPLGASSSERWMNCPGSTAFLKALKLPDTDEEDFRKEGIAAHEAAAKCVKEGLESWEVVGQTFNGFKIDPDAADAIEQYLAFVNPLKNVPDWWCEFFMSARSLHPLFYGTVDFAAVHGDLLEIVDYKHGMGIVVDPEHNPQLMYYALGMLSYMSQIKRVRMTIVQPRAYHADGPIRSWSVDAEEIRAWGETILIPAMLNAEVDDMLDAGPWCRFCPAKLSCPLLHGLFKAAATINPKMIPNMGDEALARDYKLREAVKFYLKAQDEEVFRRLQQGKTISTAKLVYKRADRVFQSSQKIDDKVVSIEEALQELGQAVYTAPELKSPAQIERLGPRAKDIVKEWAYMPQTGLTVASADDRRPEVKRTTTADVFAAGLAKLTEAS
jgi:hypothetical protein